MDRARCSSVIEGPPIVQWVTSTIPHGRPTDLFIILASAPHNKGHGMCYPVCRMVATSNHYKTHRLQVLPPVIKQRVNTVNLNIISLFILFFYYFFVQLMK